MVTMTVLYHSYDCIKSSHENRSIGRRPLLRKILSLHGRRLCCSPVSMPAGAAVQRQARDRRQRVSRRITNLTHVPVQPHRLVQLHQARRDFQLLTEKSRRRVSRPSSGGVEAGGVGALLRSAAPFILASRHVFSLPTLTTRLCRPSTSTAMYTRCRGWCIQWCRHW